MFCFLFTAVIFCLALLSGSLTTQAAPGYDKVANYSDMAAEQEIGKYGMTPILPSQVADGTYVVETDCTSPFFRILEAKLTVENGEMSAVLTMSSASYLFVYMGSAKEAAAASFEAYIPLVKENGRNTFTVPVRSLNEGIECAAYSKNREKWYGRRILFYASSLPAEALSFPVPDYDRIEAAIRLYDREHGTNTREEPGEATATTEGDISSAAGPVSMEEEDGEYSIEVDLTGGSGRASVTSPTWLYIRDGKGYAKLLWSSSYYDYMVVGSEIYLNETTDGSNSTFTIPITALNEPMTVTADTTAMGDPLEIEYTLTFYADTIGGKGRIPQEATRTVLVIALIIIVLGGILNAWIKKRRS